MSTLRASNAAIRHDLIVLLSYPFLIMDHAIIFTLNCKNNNNVIPWINTEILGCFFLISYPQLPLSLGFQSQHACAFALSCSCVRVSRLPPHLPHGAPLCCPLAPPSIARVAKSAFLTHFIIFMPDPALKLSSPSTIDVDRLLLMRACAHAYIFTFTYT